MDENFWKQRREALSKKAGHKISQHKIAVALGVTPALVGMWEADKLAPNLKLAPHMAVVYEISQKRVEEEICAQTRRITAKEPALATSK